MTTATTHPPTITPEDLLRMPDAVGYELVDGQLVERHVSVDSSRIALRIGRFLGAEASRSGEAEAFGSDLGYQCFKGDPNRIRKPDVSLVRRERLSALHGDAGYMPIPADLAGEVVSPNDLYREVIDKVYEYLGSDFRLVWVVDPKTRTMTVYRNDGSVRVFHERHEITGESALPSFRCRVGEFFAA